MKNKTIESLFGSPNKLTNQKSIVDINDRGNRYANREAKGTERVNGHWSHSKNGYVRGAEDQLKLDIENACEALYGLVEELNVEFPNIERAKKYMRNKMRGK